MFPPPYSRQPPQRTLAWLEGDTITTEEGEETRVHGWHDIRSRMADGNLLTFSQRLVSAEYWANALASGASPSISRKAGVTALRTTLPGDKRQARWLVDSAVWGQGTPGYLSSLRHLFTLTKQGTLHTPSALGLSTMAAWWDQREPKLYPPSKTIDRIVRQSLIGGRVDTIRPREEFQTCYEIDINSAHAWAAQRVPAGGCYAVSPRRPRLGVANYLRCQVRAHRRRGLLAGPLPVRDGERVTYPTEGTWTGWYWAEEVLAALQAGFRVTIEGGFEWPEWSFGLRLWAERMHSLRRDSGRGLVPSALKLCTVAGIGRFLGHETTQQLTTEETDVPYLDSQSGFLDPSGGGISPYYLEEKPRTAPELLPHVGSYILAMVRLATWRRALEEGEALIATNYDAVYTLRRPTERPSDDLGGWKWTELTNAKVEKPRWIESDQKVRRPGVAA